MQLRFTITWNRRNVTITGLGSLLALAALCIVPALLAQPLDAARAEKEIRDYLERQSSYGFLETIERSAGSKPTRAQAASWQREFQTLQRLTIEIDEINRLLFALPFSSHRIYVVKATLRREGAEDRVRYFSLSARDRFFDVFWVNESSRWLWFFSA